MIGWNEIGYDMIGWNEIGYDWMRLDAVRREVAEMLRIEPFLNAKIKMFCQIKMRSKN